MRECMITLDLNFMQRAVAMIITNSHTGWSPLSVRQCRSAGLLAMGLFVMSFSACGSATDGRPKTYPASGVVTIDGEPLGQAYVTFQTMTEPPQVAYASTNDLGEFHLTTFTTGDGAVEGEHRIQITKLEAVKETDSGSVPPGAPQPPPKKPKSLIPEKYSDFFTSGLTQKVEPGKPNKFRLELKR